MMASEEISPSQEVVECDVCQKPVSFFCRRCVVNLCDTCIPVHLRVKSKTGHDVVDYMSKDDDDTCFCDSHPKHECSAYCKTCDCPICVVCISIKHKPHEVSELSEKIEEFLNGIAQENDRLKSCRSKIEVLLDDTTKQLSSLSNVYQKEKEEVTALGKEWHKLIDDHVKKLHQELDDLKKENEALLQKQSSEFEEMILKADEMNRKYTKLQMSKNVQEIKKFKQVIDKQKFKKEIIQYTFPTFQKCKIDKHYLQKYFGYIEKKQKRKISILEKKISPGPFSEMNITGVPSVVSVIDTGFPGDRNKNRLFDMAVTDDKKVWMGGSERELKIFNLQGTLQSTVTIPCMGLYLCKYTKQVVLSDCTDNAVKKIFHDGTLVTMFTTGDWTPYGITCTTSDNLLVCLNKDNRSKVVRYSSTGTVLQEIEYDSQGKPLYQEASYISENINGDIIVTDKKKRNVTTVDRVGKFRYSYTGEEHSFSPYGVVADSMGNVIVADFWGSKIHILNGDGKFLSYIDPIGGIKHPCALAIISDGKIIVGECFTGFTKTIKF